MSNFSILEAAESLPPTAMAAQFVVVQYSSEIPLSLFTLSDSVRLYSSRPRVVILDADMINHSLVFLGNLVRRNASMLQRIMDPTQPYTSNRPFTQQPPNKPLVSSNIHTFFRNKES